jgi:hypothetical protein
MRDWQKRFDAAPVGSPEIRIALLNSKKFERVVDGVLSLLEEPAAPNLFTEQESAPMG